MQNPSFFGRLARYLSIIEKKIKEQYYEYIIENVDINGQNNS